MYRAVLGKLRLLNSQRLNYIILPNSLILLGTFPLEVEV